MLSPSQKAPQLLRPCDREAAHLMLRKHSKHMVSVYHCDSDSDSAGCTMPHFSVSPEARMKGRCPCSSACLQTVMCFGWLIPTIIWIQISVCTAGETESSEFAKTDSTFGRVQRTPSLYRFVLLCGLTQQRAAMFGKAEVISKAGYNKIWSDYERRRIYVLRQKAANRNSDCG